MGRTQIIGQWETGAREGGHNRRSSRRASLEGRGEVEGCWGYDASKDPPSYQEMPALNQLA